MAARHFERTSRLVASTTNAGRGISTIGIELTAVDMHVTAFARPSATDTCTLAFAFIKHATTGCHLAAIDGYLATIPAISTTDTGTPAISFSVNHTAVDDDGTALMASIAATDARTG